MRADFPADLPLIPSYAPPTRRASGRVIAHHMAIWALVIAVVVVSLQAGFKLRQWTWMMTDPIHFTSDIRRGFGWGYEAATNGYLNLYEKMSSQEARWNNWLDYAPLRLAVMTFWGYQTKAYFPGVDQWQASWEFNKPVLLFNMTMEALGAACAFFIVRIWLRRASDDPKPFTGWPAGLAAALLLWFNPAILLSAHGWPTWDMWIIPMYLLAVLLASYNWWFAAGVAVAFGAMFKGQQLTVAPVFLIWPLVMLRFDAMLKWTLGLAFGVALLASPWLLTYVPADAIAAMRAVQFDGGAPPWNASRLTLPERVVDVQLIVWLMGMLAVTIAGPVVLSRFRTKIAPVATSPRSSATTESTAALDYKTPEVLPGARKRYWTAAGIIAAIVTLVLVCPWLLSRNRHDFLYGLTFAIAVAAVIPFVRRPRHIAILAAGAVGLGLLSSMWYFNGSSAWWICGWKYGTFHWPVMQMGVSSNLPGILQQRYGWQSPNQLVEIWSIPPDWIFGWPKIGMELTIKQVLATIYAITLLLTAIGVGLQARRRDPRILVALTAPWLMFFCFPVQIHERYLLYAAGVGAITIGAGLGPALLVVFMSIVTWMMTLHVMLNHGSGNGPVGRARLGELMTEQFPSLFTNESGNELHRLIVGTFPDIGWAILLCAGIFLYLSLTPSRRRKPERHRLPLAKGN